MKSKVKFEDMKIEVKSEIPIHVTFYGSAGYLAEIKGVPNAVLIAQGKTKKAAIGKVKKCYGVLIAHRANCTLISTT